MKKLFCTVLILVTLSSRGAASLVTESIKVSRDYTIAMQPIIKQTLEVMGEAKKIAPDDKTLHTLLDKKAAELTATVLTTVEIFKDLVDAAVAAVTETKTS